MRIPFIHGNRDALPHLFALINSAGGNQRDQDRLKAQKKLAGQKKPKESGSNLTKRKEAYVRRASQPNLSGAGPNLLLTGMPKPCVLNRRYRSSSLITPANHTFISVASSFAQKKEEENAAAGGSSAGVK